MSRVTIVYIIFNLEYQETGWVIESDASIYVISGHLHILYNQRLVMA